MSKYRNRVYVTLSPEALETYEAVAKEMHLPLSAFLRQSLETGLPYMEHLLTALRESDPQEKLLLARNVQMALARQVVDPE